MANDFSPQGFTITVGRLTNFVRRDARVFIRNEGVKHFKKSFDDEGFTDNVLVPWKDITEARKAQKRKANGKLPGILYDTGDLQRSVTGTEKGRDIIFSSDLDYADIHNNGGTVQRANGSSFKMPKRQFIGKSKALDRKIEAKLSLGIGKILGGFFKR